MKIVLVDDEEADRMLLCRSLKRASPGSEVREHASVDDALADVRGLVRSDTATELLVLTDVKMAERSGLELVEEIRSDPALALVPVVVLSTSEHMPDVEAAYRAGCAAYHVKPLGLAEHDVFAQCLVGYWETVVLSP